MTSRVRAGRRRSCSTRSRTSSWRPWSRPRARTRTGRGPRWPSARGLSKSTIGRIWKRFDLKPHLQDSFKLSTDPQFVAKVVDVVGLYHHPPEKAVVLCVDEKSQIQALDRSQPVLPMMPGMPERRTHDYYRHGITSLFAAFNIADGTVISRLHRRHRAIEFKKFLVRDRQGGARRARRPPGLRQLRHPQHRRDQDVARQTPPLPRPLHPDRLLLDEPGRAVVRPADRQAHPPRRPHLREGPGGRHHAPGSTPGTRTHGPSPGPRPPTRSSTPSPTTSPRSEPSARKQSRNNPQDFWRSTLAPRTGNVCP